MDSNKILAEFHYLQRSTCFECLLHHKLYTDEVFHDELFSYDFTMPTCFVSSSYKLDNSHNLPDAFSDLDPNGT